LKTENNCANNLYFKHSNSDGGDPQWRAIFILLAIKGFGGILEKVGVDRILRWGSFRASLGCCGEKYG
jgi:hypothetical protein